MFVQRSSGIVKTDCKDVIRRFLFGRCYLVLSYPCDARYLYGLIRLLVGVGSEEPE